LIRYWLTPPADEQFDAKVTDICTLYQTAPTRAAQGERVVSTDELTGVQALERRHPGLPLAPGHVERREFEYRRHGTCSFILSRDVVSGAVLAPTAGPTRTEADFLAHVQGVVATEPAARWHFVVDNLDIHRSASSSAGSRPRPTSAPWTWAKKANTASWPGARRGRLS